MPTTKYIITSKYLSRVTTILKSLIHPNTTNFKTYKEKGLYVMIWRLTLMYLLVLSIIFISSLSDKQDKHTLTGLFGLVSIVCLVYIKLTNRIKQVGYVYLSVGIILINYSILTKVNNPHLDDIAWILTAIIFSFVFYGNRTGIVVSLINFLSLAYFFWYKSENYYASMPHVFSQSQKFTYILEIGLSFMMTGYILKLHVDFLNQQNNDISASNKELNKQIKENRTLIKEVHHRVKNNLQIITSLLRIQMHSEGIDSETKKHFEEAINRIMAMAITHSKLYQSEDLAFIDIDEYIPNLVTEIEKSYGANKDVNLILNTELKQLGLNSIIPVGLLLNELISNSYKHAFQEEIQRQEISIKIHPIDHTQFTIQYKDTGTWRDKGNAIGFGLDLIETLVDQLEGKVERTNTTYNFTLKNLDVS